MVLADSLHCCMCVRSSVRLSVRLSVCPSGPLPGRAVVSIDIAVVYSLCLCEVKQREGERGCDETIDESKRLGILIASVRLPPVRVPK